MGQSRITPASEDVKSVYRKDAAELDRIKPYKIVVNKRSGTISKRFHSLYEAMEYYQKSDGTKLLLDFNAHPVRFVRYSWEQR